MKVLVTGFQPFGEDTMNPAYEAVKRLPEEIAGARIVKREIPVVFYEGGDAVEAAIREERPDIVLCVGQAGGAACLCVERVAVNLAECRQEFPDNAGNAPQGRRIRRDGKDAYFATLPVRAMIEAIQENGIPATVSYSAGSYVCNDVMYNLLYLLDTKYPGVKGGFIHVPFDVKQVIGRSFQTPSMPVDTICEGLRCAIEAAIRHRVERPVAEAER